MPKIQEEKMYDKTPDINLDELSREHQRLIELSMVGDPPRGRLKAFWQKLHKAKSRTKNPHSLRNIEFYIMYWKGFLRHSGQFEALDVDSDEA